jgi:hypothetical protein
MKDIMSNCLGEARLRAVADGEADTAANEHVESCRHCQRRVDEARQALAEIARLAAAIEAPPSLIPRVTHAIARSGAAEAGATTLREAPGQSFRPRAWGSAISVAAVLLIIALFLPAPDAPRELSAAEILGRSLQTMTPTGGTERREFDLSLQLPTAAAIENGAYRIEELIDHDAPGRYRVSRYAADGTLVSAMTEDMAAGRRTVLFRLGGQVFAFTFALDSSHRAGVRDIEGQHVEGMIRLLQAMAGHTVSERDAAGRRQYVVELPSVSGGGGAAGLWDLQQARVVVDGESFRLVDVAVSGSYLGDPFSVSFHLRRREVRPSAEVGPGEFDPPHDPAAIAIEGAGTDDVPRDLLTTALGELARRRRSLSTP